MIAPKSYAVQNHKDEERWYGRLILIIIVVAAMYFGIGVLLGTTL